MSKLPQVLSTTNKDLQNILSIAERMIMTISELTEEKIMRGRIERVLLSYIDQIKEIFKKPSFRKGQFTPQDIVNKQSLAKNLKELGTVISELPYFPSFKRELSTIIQLLEKQNKSSSIGPSPTKKQETSWWSNLQKTFNLTSNLNSLQTKIKETWINWDKSTPSKNEEVKNVATSIKEILLMMISIEPSKGKKLIIYLTPLINAAITQIEALTAEEFAQDSNTLNFLQKQIQNISTELQNMGIEIPAFEDLLQKFRDLET